MREIVKATQRELLRFSRKPQKGTIAYLSCKMKKQCDRRPKNNFVGSVLLVLMPTACSCLPPPLHVQ